MLLDIISPLYATVRFVYIKDCFAAIGTMGGQDMLDFFLCTLSVIFIPPFSIATAFWYHRLHSIDRSQANTRSHVTVHFARPYDLSKGTVGFRLRAVKPTMFLGVPRVWEKIQAKIKKIGWLVSWLGGREVLSLVCVAWICACGLQWMLQSHACMR